jgi:flavodoxin
MKALIVWESLTGTTRKAAEKIASELRASGHQATVSPVTNVDLAALSAADVVIVGSWTDGLVFVGQKPGRQSRLWTMPFLTGKRAFVYCTYAVDAGHAVEKLADIARDRGAEVLGTQKVHRFHLDRDCSALVQQVLAGVPAA